MVSVYFDTGRTLYPKCISIAIHIPYFKYPRLNLLKQSAQHLDQILDLRLSNDDDDGVSWG